MGKELRESLLLAPPAAGTRLTQFIAHKYTPPFYTHCNKSYGAVMPCSSGDNCPDTFTVRFVFQPGWNQYSMILGWNHPWPIVTLASRFPCQTVQPSPPSADSTPENTVSQNMITLTAHSQESFATPRVLSNYFHPSLPRIRQQWKQYNPLLQPQRRRDRDPIQ